MNNPLWFVDRQDGPECGFEALENAIQQFWPVGNEVSETILKQLANKHRVLMPDGSLNPAGYQTLLSYYKISSWWRAFDHGVLIQSLDEGRVVVAIVDAFYIDRNYPRESGHALLLTNVVRDQSTGLVIGYGGVDSNYPGRALWWDAQAFSTAAQYYAPNSLLITQARAAIE
jgi:hypothetical protein